MAKLMEKMVGLTRILEVELVKGGQSGRNDSSTVVIECHFDWAHLECDSWTFLVLWGWMVAK